MHWELIAGDGDCGWTSIITALVKEHRSDLRIADHKLMRDRVAKLNAQTFECAMKLKSGRDLHEPDREKVCTERCEKTSEYGRAMTMYLDLIELIPGEALGAEKKTVGWLRQHLNFLIECSAGIVVQISLVWTHKLDCSAQHQNLRTVEN